MRSKTYLLISVFLASIFACSPIKNNDSIIIGIPSDVETLNPLYAFSVEEGNITELSYLSLIESSWDSSKGEIKYSPMISKSWDWDSEKNSITLTISDDILWSDSVMLTIQDIIFSFDIYSDPKVMSRVFGYFDNFYTFENGQIDTSKTFDVLSKTQLKINFKQGTKPSLTDIDFPILPKHFWGKYNRADLPNIAIDKYVTNGAYFVDTWDKESAIVLRKNVNSFLVTKSSIEKIIFKIIPDYQNRISQLLSEEIDLMQDIKTDDIQNIRANSNLIVKPVAGRDFDYIGWNNISPSDFENGKIVPNKYFGDSAVRNALTIALNRAVVVDEYLNGFGSVAQSPVSSIFKTIYNNQLSEIKFNLDVAKIKLEENGWVDSNGDGTIDKNGNEFEFTLHIPSGNPRREFAASLFQNNLKSIGIDMNIESNELGVFIDNLFEKKYDAWMAAWVVPIPINLKVSWYSDLDSTPLNFASFRNKKLDLLFDKLDYATENDKIEIYKSIQKVLYQNQPYSFLYWIDNISSYNKRMKNISIDPLGSVKHCWDWEL